MMIREEERKSNSHSRHFSFTRRKSITKERIEDERNVLLFRQRSLISRQTSIAETVTRIAGMMEWGMKRTYMWKENRDQTDMRERQKEGSSRWRRRTDRRERLSIWSQTWKLKEEEEACRKRKILSILALLSLMHQKYLASLSLSGKGLRIRERLMLQYCLR